MGETTVRNTYKQCNEHNQHCWRGQRKKNPRKAAFSIGASYVL